jgi:hypothetical protein
VGEDGQVVVDVDDPAFRGARLRYLVDVVGGRQARADVKELTDSLLLGKEPDHPPQERAVLPRDAGGVRFYFENPGYGLPVGLVIVLSSEQRVIYPRHVGGRYVKPFYRPRILNHPSVPFPLAGRAAL